MTYLIIGIMVFAVASTLAAQIVVPKQKEGIDMHRLLYAIRTVEDWKGRDGPRGEKGPYQIMPEVYERITGRAYPEALVAALACTDEVAVIAHIQWITDQFKRNREPVTIRSIALVYGAGLTAFLNGTYSNAKNDYAWRVVNVYCDKTK